MSGVSWKEVQTEAKAKNKYIFMDCYATWCGPCKYMSQHIFTQKEVGNFFDEHFISVAVQMDKTLKDSPAIQDWYSDATMISNDFNVKIYPTYLIFSPDGLAIHRFSGSSTDVKNFLDKASEAFDPSKQYYSLMKEWSLHKEDSVYLLRALKAALKESDKRNAEIIGDAYVDCLKNPLTKDNVEFLHRLIYLIRTMCFACSWKTPERSMN